MSIIKNNPLLQEVHGKLGTSHAYRKSRGKMYMVNLPKKPDKLNPEQKAFSERFKKAVNYAKAIIEDEETKALYETGITEKKQSAYVVAVSDFLNAPQVGVIKTADYQGAIGDRIAVEATDDFRVVRVRFILYDSEGNKLEQGEAVQDPKIKHVWKYTTTVANPQAKGTRIAVTAFDFPENETTREAVVE